jgi:YggT family protein
MFVIANLLFAIAQVLDYLLWAYMWVLIARVVVSFTNADRSIPVVRFLYSITEPVLAWLRRRWPMIYGNYDLSPFALLILIVFVQRFVVRTLYDLAYRLS